MSLGESRGLAEDFVYYSASELSERGNKKVIFELELSANMDAGNKSGQRPQPLRRNQWLRRAEQRQKP